MRMRAGRKERDREMGETAIGIGQMNSYFPYESIKLFHINEIDDEKTTSNRSTFKMVGYVHKPSPFVPAIRWKLPRCMLICMRFVFGWIFVYTTYEKLWRVFAFDPPHSFHPSSPLTSLSLELSAAIIYWGNLNMACYPLVDFSCFACDFSAHANFKWFHSNLMCWID